MIGTLLLELAAKSMLSGGVALLALRLLGRRSASERSHVAHLGLSASLAIPLLALLAPHWSLAPTPAEMPVSMINPAFVSAPTGIAVAGPIASPDPVAWEVVVRLLYLLPAAALILTTAIAVLRLYPLRDRAAIIVEQPWLNALAHAQRRLGFKNGAALLVSPDIRSPVSWGLMRPTIIIDPDTLTGETDAEAIIAHELAHVANLDWAKLLLARILVAMLWFNPFAWVLARRCHDLREQSADDAVIRSAIDRVDYAALLVNAARPDKRHLLAANGVAPSPGSLRHRITRVLDDTLARRQARVGWSLACVALGAAIGMPLAALTFRPSVPNHAAPPIVAPPQALISSGSIVGGQVRRQRMEPTSRPVRIADARSARLPIAAPVRVAEAAPQGVSLNRPAAAAFATPIPVGARTSAAPIAYGFGEMAALRSQGVGQDWLNEMQALGYRDLPFDAVMGMAVQGVSPSYVRAMMAAGYPGLSPRQLIRLRIYGVSAKVAARMARSRSPRPSAEQLTEAVILGDVPPGDDED